MLLNSWVEELWYMIIQHYYSAIEWSCNILVHIMIR